MSAQDAAGPPVACIVLNWNSWQDTVACLAGLRGIEYGNITVIVVDNGSTNDSVTRIRQAHPAVELICTGRNLGYAGGVNAGIRPALERGAEFVWLLNNDAKPCPNALSALVGKALDEPDLGAVGSVLMYMSSQANVQAWGGGRVNRWLGWSAHATSGKEDPWFDYLTGASLLLRRAALEKVGLFDDGFFLYWEDTDLGFRLRRRGWRLGVAAESVVLHKEGASSGDRRRVDRHSTASGIRFLRKHAPIPWISVPLFLASRIVNRLVRGDFAHTSDIIGGLCDYMASAKMRKLPAREQPD
jgi:GT2 family glycosyltransferase